jgi:hypothetical protein
MVPAGIELVSTEQTDKNLRKTMEVKRHIWKIYSAHVYRFCNVKEKEKNVKTFLSCSISGS